MINLKEHEEEWTVSGWGVWLADGFGDQPLALFRQRTTAEDYSRDNCTVDVVVLPFAARLVMHNAHVPRCTCHKPACTCGPSVTQP